MCGVRCKSPVVAKRSNSVPKYIYLNNVPSSQSITISRQNSTLETISENGVPVIKNTECINDGLDSGKVEVNRLSDIRLRSATSSSKKVVGVRQLSSGIVADMTEEETDCLDDPAALEDEASFTDAFEMLLGDMIKEVAKETLEEVNKKTENDVITNNNLSHQIIEEEDDDIEDEEGDDENNKSLVDQNQEELYQETAKILVAKVLANAVLQFTSV